MAIDKVVEIKLSLSDHQTTVHPSASPINQSTNHQTDPPNPTFEYVCWYENHTGGQAN